MDVFDLMAKIGLDTSEYEANIKKSSGSFSGFVSDVGKGAKNITAAGKTVAEAFRKEPIEKVKTSFDGLTSTVDSQKKKLADLRERYADLYLTHGKNSKEAKVCAKEIKQLSRELSDNEKKLNEAKKSSDKFDKSLDEVGKAADKSKGKLSGFLSAIGNGFKTAVTVGVGAVTALSAALVATTESTRQYRNEMAKLDTAFTTMGHTSEAAKNTYKALQGVLGETDQAVEASNHLAKLADNEEDLQKWTHTLTGVYATFGASLPIEGLAEAANETAKVGQVTGPLADALNWAGVSEDAFNASLAACSSEQERQSLILDTLNVLYSDAADSFKETNADIIAANEANERWNESLAKVGATFEPVLTAVKNVGALLLESLAPALENAKTALQPLINKFTAYAESGQLAEDVTNFVTDAVDLLKGAFDLLSPVISLIIDGFKSIIDWGRQNEEIVKVLAIAVGVLAAAVVAYNIAQGIYTTITTIATAVTGAFGAVMAVVTSPITLVVLAIGALIAIIYLLIDNWDAVSQAASDCWNWIVGVWNTVATWFDENVIQPVVGFFTQLGEDIKLAFSEAWDWVVSLWNGAGEFFTGIWDGIKNAFSSVSNWFEDTFSQAWQKVKDVFTVGGKIFDGIKDGILSAFKFVVNGIIDGLNWVIAEPFEGINGIFDTIEGIDIIGLKPFAWLTWRLPVPQIPKLSTGLWNVPYDEYPALLHRGESVLTASQADTWRRNQDGKKEGGVITINQYIQSVAQTPVDFANATQAYFEQARWAI